MERSAITRMSVSALVSRSIFSESLWRYLVISGAVEMVPIY
jgi:hypothetical protein